MCPMGSRSDATAQAVGARVMGQRSALAGQHAFQVDAGAWGDAQPLVEQPPQALRVAGHLH